MFDLWPCCPQSDSTGKLGFHEFKYLWNNIKRWQVSDIFVSTCFDFWVDFLWLPLPSLISWIFFVVVFCRDSGMSLFMSSSWTLSWCRNSPVVSWRFTMPWEKNFSLFVCLLQKIYIAHDADRSGVICSRELPAAFKDAGVCAALSTTYRLEITVCVCVCRFPSEQGPPESAFPSL